MQSWLSILILFALGAGFGAFNVFISQFLGPSVVTPEKQAPYECGVPPVGDARERQSVKFYLVAMVFLLFDIEVAFLYPVGDGAPGPGLDRVRAGRHVHGDPARPATSTSGARACSIGGQTRSRARMAARARKVSDGTRTAA